MGGYTGSKPLDQGLCRLSGKSSEFCGGALSGADRPRMGTAMTQYTIHLNSSLPIYIYIYRLLSYLSKVGALANDYQLS